MIPFSTIVQNTNKSWVFTWPSQGAAFYRVILWGKQIGKTTGLTFTWIGQDYTTVPPPLEIAYENQPVQSELFSPILTVQWYGIGNAKQYNVQQLSGAVWNTIATIQESGQWVYTWTTPILLDGTVYSYRVFAVDSAGNQSVPRTYQRQVVTNPTPPDKVVQVGYTNPNIIVSHV
jgi:hypothetical protein